MGAARRSVSVIGGGRWGLALATAAARNGHDALLFSRRHEPPAAGAPAITRSSDVAAAMRHAHVVLLAVPSSVLRDVARALGDVADGSHLLVHAIRGLSGEGLVPLSQVLREETPCRRVGALGGPALADDLLSGRPSVLAVASPYPEVCDAVSGVLQGPRLRVSTSRDLIGLEWASALNGALFVALGYARAIGIPAALLGGFLIRGLHEAAGVAAAAGAEKQSLFELGGAGDLMAAMGQDDRPECQLGAALATGTTLAEALARSTVRIEAPTLVPRVVAFARERRVEATIFETIQDVFDGTVDRDTIVARLMHRR